MVFFTCTLYCYALEFQYCKDKYITGNLDFQKGVFSNVKKITFFILLFTGTSI